MIWWILAGLLLVLIVFGWYLSSTAGRLDRLHRRVDDARASLDRALLRRCSVVNEVVAQLQPDPGTAILLADAAHESLRAADADDLERGLVESNLTVVLGAAFEDPETVRNMTAELGSAELAEDLASATRSVEMTRRFLNDAVRACAAVRDKRIVRWLSLAGHTPWPVPFEMDDTPPAGFGVR